MRVKSGDIVEFIALEWVEPQWEFDHPTVVLLPLISYSPHGEGAESMIEDMCMDLAISADSIEEKEMLDEDVSAEFTWRRWDIKRMKKVAKKRLSGIPEWETKSAKVTKTTVVFNTYENETSYTILKTGTV